MKKILIIGTGGTISCKPTDHGLSATLSAEAIVEASREKLADKTLDLSFAELMNIDSTLIQPEDWIKMAEEVSDKYDHYDGFVISHGTDTLSYSASMLSFMLRSPGKPIVLTGSMKTLDAEESDAVTNITDAIRFAAEGVAGVFVVFNRKIIMGSRVCKIASMNIDAFESVNSPYVAFMTGDGINYRDVPPAPTESFSADTRIDSHVFLLKIVPGLEPELVRTICNAGISGLVIESFGAGGLPYRGRDILAVVGEAATKMPVVLTSQVLYDGVNLQTYEVGRKARQAGVISARDMTTESAITKLMWALGQTRNVGEVRAIFQTSLAGEIRV